MLKFLIHILNCPWVLYSWGFEELCIHEGWIPKLTNSSAPPKLQKVEQYRMQLYDTGPIPSFSYCAPVSGVYWTVDGHLVCCIEGAFSRASYLDAKHLTTKCIQKNNLNKIYSPSSVVFIFISSAIRLAKSERVISSRSQDNPNIIIITPLCPSIVNNSRCL